MRSPAVSTSKDLHDTVLAKTFARQFFVRVIVSKYLNRSNLVKENKNGLS